MRATLRTRQRTPDRGPVAPFFSLPSSPPPPPLPLLLVRVSAEISLLQLLLLPPPLLLSFNALQWRIQLACVIRDPHRAYSFFGAGFTARAPAVAAAVDDAAAVAARCDLLPLRMGQFVAM